jgi:hypothetical protein
MQLLEKVKKKVVLENQYHGFACFSNSYWKYCFAASYPFWSKGTGLVKKYGYYVLRVHVDFPGEDIHAACVRVAVNVAAGITVDMVVSVCTHSDAIHEIVR